MAVLNDYVVFLSSRLSYMKEFIYNIYHAQDTKAHDDKILRIDRQSRIENSSSLRIVHESKSEDDQKKQLERHKTQDEFESIYLKHSHSEDSHLFIDCGGYFKEAALY